MATPKLRFKGFYEKWQLTQLKDKADFLAGYAFSSKLMSNNICQYQLIKMSNIYKNKLDINRNPSYWQSINKKTEKYLLSKGDIVLTLTGTVGKKDYGYSVEINKNDKYLLNQRLVRIKGKEEESTSKFLHYRVSTSIFYYHFFNAAKGGTGNQANVSVEDIKLIKILFPSIKEQTKIATFLSAVDTKIDELTQKHELLVEYKKGMMQQIFSQKLRFKADDGSDFEDWEESKFSEFFTFHMTNSLSRAKLSEQGNVMNIHYGDIHTKFSTLFDTTKEDVSFIKNKTDALKIKSDQFLQIGDLIIADASEDYDDIGKTLEIINLDGKKAVAGLHTYIARPNQTYATGFCGYMMQAEKIRKQIKVLATGISVLGISKTNLNKLDLAMPSLPEQTKIASFLTAIDQKIDNVAEQIDHAKTWKKGLLQQMFV
ncbi:restriction endonuclease subunit S [Thiomicrospira sp.]|uniref:restriction endonuclease subunit S n=1 Tax=Thiomicrospira sp. TaxID=935 RepID=UPI002F9230BF